MKKRNYTNTFIIALLTAAMAGSMILTGCSASDTDTSAASSVSSSVSASSAGAETVSTPSDSTASTVTVDSNDTDSSYNESESVKITLNGSSADINGNGAKADGGTITISAAGTYIISGTLDDGQIVIEAGKNDTVKLILNNATIKSSTTAAIYASKCEKTIIVLEDGTTNTISDGSNYTDTTETSDTEDDSDSNSPNAAIFIQDDLTILGTGTLNVTGNSNNGITSKDTLKITSGTINVTAVHHGITGKDNLYISGGTVNVTSTSGDGLRSTYSDTDKEEKGHIYIENADITVTAGKDGIQAEKNLIINSGTINIVTNDGAPESTSNTSQGGFGFNQGSNSTSSDSTSAKGLKAGSNITINDGAITIDSYDDAIHSNGDVTISGGTINIKTGDDAVHADNTLTIKNGTITISQSYEGLEGTAIDISGGTIDLTASDDGVNASGGNDGSGFGNFDGGRGFGPFAGQQFNTQNTSAEDGNSEFTVIQTANTADNADSSSSLSTALNISGGTLYVNAQGDGLDSNGNMNISGGTIIINGTTNNGDGILDHDGTCIVTGGTIIGAGTSGMLEMPSASSTQTTVAVLFDQTQSAGTLVYITDESGNILAAMAPEKNYSCLIFSSSELSSSTYNVYIGGTATGDAVNGYYNKAVVSGGTLYTSFTPSDIVTYVDSNGVTSYSGGMGGGRGQMTGGFGGDNGQTPQMPDQNGDTNQQGFGGRGGRNMQTTSSNQISTADV